MHEYHMITFLDVETTFQITDKGAKDPSPFLPDNYLVSVGYSYEDTDEYVFFRHNDLGVCGSADYAQLQKVLDETNILVAHNAKFDLEWLLECGFTYSGEVYCTMIGEFVLNRGLRKPLSLEALCHAHDLPLKKSGLIEEYLRDNTGFEDIPWEIVQEYGEGDITSLKSLYYNQIAEYEQPSNKILAATRKMMNEFLIVITEMERNGIKIDTEALQEIADDYQIEKTGLENDLRKLIKVFMGDTQISLTSSEDISKLIYSREVLDKRAWITTFNIGMELRGESKKPKRRPKMKKGQFEHEVRGNTRVLRKTRAEQCPNCRGYGTTQGFKKNGQPRKLRTKCTQCSATGVVYHNTNEVAGLRQIPKGVNDAADGGFKTNRDTLEELAYTATGDVLVVLEKMVRLNAVTTYLGTFVEGFWRGLNPATGIIHPSFTQTIAVTGRRTGRNPNFHNLPRGNTFPLRRALISRFDGGDIMAADFSTLEFRCAVFQAQDKQGMEDIANNVDVHSFTAETITAAGQHTNRQDAKSHTFKPLYGGTSGTKPERAYYKAFVAKYEGIDKWQQNLQEQAITTHTITLPTGRQYAFPYAKRMLWGGSSYATQIKNYPVQGFATADIVPVAGIALYRAMVTMGVQSKLILEVHDELVVDCYPGEREIMTHLYQESMGQVHRLMKERYDINMNVPIDIEISAGPNWLEKKEI
jgi:DNA polymerase I-like protein with 3'-5' exonuclease and polymerase domains